MTHRQVMVPKQPEAAQFPKERLGTEGTRALHEVGSRLWIHR